MHFLCSECYRLQKEWKNEKKKRKSDQHLYSIVTFNS